MDEGIQKKKELVQYVTIRAMFFHGYVQGITCVSEPLTILKDLKLRQKTGRAAHLYAL